MYFIPLPFFIFFMIGDMYGRKKNNLKIVSICQPMTTVTALITALLSFTTNFRMTYTVWIMIALAVAAFADSILVSRTDKSAFVKGMALFFVTIVIYGVTWFRLNGLVGQDKVILPIILVIYMIMAVIFLRAKGGVDGKPSKKVTIGVLIYMLTFLLVISRAISTFYGEYFTLTQSILITVGSISFFLGDCQLGIYHFIDIKFPMVQAPPFYFIGQLLIALSCSYF